jgi:hypothetical protein
VCNVVTHSLYPGCRPLLPCVIVSVGIFANFTFPKSCAVMSEVIATKFGGVDPYCTALSDVQSEYSAATASGVRGLQGIKSHI